LKQNWFEKWFESDDYLKVYQHRDESEANLLVKLILNHVKLKPKSSILDIACGAGRHSISFAKEGFNVIGFDISRNLLNYARLKAEEKGLNIKFISSDVRTFSFDCKFDLSLNLFTSFGYFESDDENLSVFKIASTHTKKGGYFVFDYFNTEYLKNNLVESSFENFGDFQIEQIRAIEGNRVNKKIRIIKNEIGAEYNESVQLYIYDWLKNSLKSFGFDIIYMFGNYEGNQFDIKTSPRIIFICQKVS